MNDKIYYLIKFEARDGTHDIFIVTEVDSCTLQICKILRKAELSFRYEGMCIAKGYIFHRIYQDKDLEKVLERGMLEIL